MDDTTAGRDAAGMGTAGAQGNDDTGRVGFCQECGRLLTRETLRRRGDGVFCAPCAEVTGTQGSWQRVHTSGGGVPPGWTGMGAGVPGGGAPRRGDEPRPAVAAVLGLIPGVGAMFNGQFAKSAMHLIVFVILVALADNVYWVFWWLVWGWIFYQAFDAYHTARARRDHLPLPNPFGLNEMGEQMGFGTGPVPTQSVAPPPTAASTQAPHWANYVSPQTRAAVGGTDWVGYVSPQTPGVGTAEPAGSRPNDNPYAMPYAVPGTPVGGATSVPYAPTYTGAPGQAAAATVPSPVPGRRPIRGTRRFPLGALWLIGLGIVFLLGNVLPSLQLTGRWFAPLLLVALALWTGFRKIEVSLAAQAASGLPMNLISALVGPTILLTLAVLLALQTAAVVPMRRSWPVLLVIWGTMLLLQRSVATPLTAMGAVEADLGSMPPAPPPPPTRSTAGTGSLGL